MASIEQHVASGLLAALTAGVAGFGLVWWRKRGPAEGEHPPGTPAAHDPTWAAPALLMLVFITLSAAMLGAAPLRPRSAADWLPWAALVAGLLGVTADSVRIRAPLKWGVRWCMLAVVFTLVAANAIRNSWPWWETLLCVPGAASVTLASWASLARVTNHTRGPRGPILALGTCAAAGAALVLTGDLKLALGTWYVAAALGGALLVSWLRPRLTLARGGAHVPVVIAGASLFIGIAFGECQGWHAALVMAIPMTGGAAEAWLPAGLRGWKRTLAVAAAGAAPGLAVVVPLTLAEVSQRAADPGHGSGQFEP